MTQDEAIQIKSGQRVRHGKDLGVVDMATAEGNYIRVVWGKRRRPDILSRTSPLLLALELEL